MSEKAILGRRCVLAALLLMALATVDVRASAQTLAEMELQVLGARLAVSPAQLTVPKDIPTSIAVGVVVADDASDASVRAIDELTRGATVACELRGPELAPTTIFSVPGEPIQLPALRVPGEYVLDDIRLERQGQVILTGQPSFVPIQVIPEVLVTKVTTRQLSLEEIQERGIVVDSSSFRVLEFQTAFVIDGIPTRIDFPVILPNASLAATPKRLREPVALASEDAAQRNLEENVVELPPELQRPGLNLFLVGAEFVPVAPSLDEEPQLEIPPIPALVVIPGNIGFLNQFFSAIVMVENSAPGGSNLVVTNIRAEIRLPTGKDRVPGTTLQPGDDPLRIARTQAGEAAVVPVVQPGIDGELGTSDDVVSLPPGGQGEGEFLIEGLREGTHVFDIDLFATLEGLPSGPVALMGKAKGAVVVKNPTFSLSLSHPDVVRAGEPYELYATVMNTSDATQNLVSVTLDRRAVNGGILLSEETVTFETLGPGESGTARFRVLAQATGAVTFSQVTAEPGVTSNFVLHAGVDERGVPLSPSAIVLPIQTRNLPDDLVLASQRVLGQALSVATAPRLPRGVRPILKRTVLTRGREMADVGIRFELGEPPLRGFSDLALDWLGAGPPDAGFDQLLRSTEAGDAWAAAIGQTLALKQTGSVLDLHRAMEEALVARPPHVSAAIGSGAGPAPAQVRIVDPIGLASAGAIGDPSPRSTLPFAGTLPLEVQPDARSEVALAARLVQDRYTIEARGTGAGTIDLGVAIPLGDAGIRHLRFEGLAVQAGTLLRVSVDRTQTSTDPQLQIDQDGDGGFETVLAATSAETLANGAPTLLAARAITTLDRAGDRGSFYGFIGQLVEVLFSEPIDEASAEDPARYVIANNRVRSAVLQPTGRVATLFLEHPIGTLLPRDIAVGGVLDRSGDAQVTTSISIAGLLGDGASLVGQVRRADGLPVPSAVVRASFYFPPARAEIPFAVRTADAFGYYDLDFLRRDPALLPYFRIEAFDPVTGDSVSVTSRVRFQGERIAVNPIFFGRGRVTGRLLLPDGTPAGTSAVNLFPDRERTGEEARGVFSNADGTFVLEDVPVGTFALRAEQVELRLNDITGNLDAFLVGPAATVSGVVRASGETVELEVTLFPPAQPGRGLVRGRVFLGDGVTPAPMVAVFLGAFDRIKRTVTPIAEAESDDSGTFELRDIPVGIDYDVVAFDRATGQVAIVTASVTADAATAVNIVFGATGAVTGVVRNASGQLVPDALVSGGFELVTADANGRFTIPEVPIGLRSIAAGDPITHRVGSNEVDVFPGRSSEVEIILQAAADIRGRVTDALGNPIARADVRIPVPGAGYFKAESDPDGLYVFPNMPLGSYLVSAQGGGPNAPPQALSPDELATQLRDDFSEAARSRDIAAIRAAFQDAVQVFVGTTSSLFQRPVAPNPGRFGFIRDVRSFQDGVAAIADITYIPTGRIAGFTQDSEGRGTKAALQLIGLSLDEFGSPKVGHLRFADSDVLTGAFDLGFAPHGDYTVKAGRPFSPLITHRGVLNPQNLDDDDLVLRFASVQETSGTISGAILQPDGITPAGENLEVLISFGGLTVLTDPDGLFVSPLPIPQGTYSLDVTDLVTGLRGRASVSVRAGTNVDARIRLLARDGVARVEVRRPDGTLVPGATVELTGGTTARITRLATTDAQGEALFPGLEEGFYQVLAREGDSLAGRGGLEVTQGLALAAGEVGLVVTIQGFGTITGTFLQPDGVTPVPDAQVSLRTRTVQASALGVTGPDGRFQFDRVPVGPFSVVAVDPTNLRSGAGSGSLVAQGQIVDVTVFTGALGRVEGIVLSADGQTAIAGASVELKAMRAATGAVRFPILTADPTGAFAFEGVPEGAFEITAFDPQSRFEGMGAGVVTAEGEVVFVEVRIDPFGTIQGTVLDLAGQPVGAAEVTLIEGDRPLRIGPVIRTTAVESDGTWRFERVPLGTYTLSAQRTDPLARLDGGLVRPVALDEAGEVLDLPITLLGIADVTVHVVDAGGQPVPSASVRLTSHLPFRGTFDGATSSTGSVTFPGVPVGGFDVGAEASQLLVSGAADGTVTTAGQPVAITVELGNAGAVSGRLILPDLQTPVPEAFVTLFFTAQASFGSVRQQQTDALGLFRFDPVPEGPFRIEVLEVLSGGRRLIEGAITQNEEEVLLGDVVLDLDAPRIASVSPADGATGVAPDPQIALTFHEPIVPSSVFVAGATGAGNIVLVEADTGRAVATSNVQVTDGDTVVRFTPAAPLRSEVRYEIVVVNGSGTVIDAAAHRPVLDPAVFSFTTADSIPPDLISASPQDGAEEVLAEAVVRVTFSEAMAGGLSLALDRGGVPVPGATGLIVGSTVAVFTPDGPLALNERYTFTLTQAADLAGNALAQGTVTGTFATLDTRGPAIASLDVTGQPTQIGGTPVTVAPTLVDADAVRVEYALDGVPAAARTTAPFSFTFTLPSSQAQQIVTAVAIDAAGNRGSPLALPIAVATNQPPLALLAGPAGGLVTAGQTADVTLTTTDDVALAEVFVSVVGAASQGSVIPLSGTQVVTQVPVGVPASAAPGATLTVQAIAVDAAGNESPLAQVALTVQDGAPPTVQIPSPVDGAQVLAGQTVSVVVAASDAGGVRSVTLVTTPAIPGAGTRSLATAALQTTQTFSLQVPAGLSAPQSITLRASATDDAGNPSAEVTRTLVIADTAPPTITSLALVGGLTRVLPGQTVTARATATDNLEVSRIDLAASGVTTVTTSADVTPPASPASADLVIAVPQSAPTGTTLTITASARDRAGNQSAASTLVIDVGDPDPPVVTILSPPPGTEVPLGGSLDVVVQATDGVGLASLGLDVSGAVTTSLSRAVTTTGGLAQATFQVQVPAQATPGGSIDLVGTADDLAGNTGFSVLRPVTVEVPTGVVRGDVTGPTGQIVAGANMRVTATNGTFLTTTDALGAYRVPGVAPGPVVVRGTDPSSGITGDAQGTLALGQAELVLDLVLRNAGSISGRVLEPDGVTPAGPGIEVTVNRSTFGGPQTVATDAQGAYAFPLVEVGSFTLAALDPADGNRGQAMDQIAVPGESRAVDIPLLGFGEVLVTVEDSLGTPEVGALVTLRRPAPFPQTLSLTTTVTGTARFPGVLAGSFTVEATDAAGIRSGQAGGTVAAGATEPATITLSAQGTIDGVVRAPDGTTPLAGIDVLLLTPGLSLISQATSTVTGTFAFPGLAEGGYRVEARDAGGRLRARESVQLTAPGATRDLVFVALGSVTGTVRQPNQSLAAGATVTLQSLHPLLGGTVQTVTAGDGTYRFDDVPAGTVDVDAALGALRGEAIGTLTQDGQTLALDIGLLDNTVTLPRTLTDANRHGWQIRADGAADLGTQSVFLGDGNQERGAPVLELVQGFQTLRFSGSSIGTEEDGGRELAVSQSGLFGLDVTRKVFVPDDAYLARYLERLENPTAQDITVDVRLRLHFRSGPSGQPRVRMTESGDAILDVASPTQPDGWYVVDDNADGGALDFNNRPAVAHVVAGAGAADRPDASIVFVSGQDRRTQAITFSQVTVPAGGSVTLLHVVAQQRTRAAARASAERIAQMPPELLEGLSPAELAAVRSFALPQSGASALAPLPPVDGIVTGRVLSGDGATPVASASLQLVSDVPVFPNLVSGFTQADGTFRIDGRSPVASGPVPASGFTLTSTVQVTGAVATASGDFSGTLTGTLSAVRGVASASSQNASFPASQAIDGSLQTGWLAGPGDAANLGQSPFVEVDLGGEVTVEEVRVRGNRQFPNGFDIFQGRFTLLDASGAVLHDTGPLDLPGPDRDLDVDVPDTPSVRRVRFTSTADESQSPGLSEVSVLGSASRGALRVASVDLVFAGTGVLTGTVRRHTGATVAAGSVRVVLPSGFQPTATIAADGTYAVAALPPGTFPTTASVSHPQGSALTVTGQGTVASGQRTTLDLTLGGVGHVAGRVLDGDQVTPVAFRTVSLVPPPGVQGGTYSTQSAFSTGAYRLDGVPAGDYVVRVSEPLTGVVTAQAATVVTDQTSTVDLVLIGRGTVNVTATFPGGAPAPSATVQIQEDARSTSFRGAGSTDANGARSIANVTVGAFTVRVQRPGTTLFGFATGQVGQHGEVVPAQVVLPVAASVRVTVLRADGSPFAGARVEIRHAASGGQFTDLRFADANGVVTFPNVPEGPYDILVRDPSTVLFHTSASGTVGAGDEGQTLSTTAPAAISGAVVGTVVAGDGQTPIPFVQIQARDAISGNGLRFGSTSASGAYQLTDVAAGAGGFVVRASSPTDPSLFVERSGQIASPGQTSTVDLTLPVALVRGTVTFADGQPATSCFVTLTPSSGGGAVTAFTDTNGEYVIVGPPVGAFQLEATPTSFALRGTASGTVASSSDVVQVDIQLEPDGTVLVSVEDAAGAPVTGFLIGQLIPVGGAQTPHTAFTFGGVAQFPRVPLGTVTVQVRDATQTTTLHATVRGRLDTSGQTIQLDLRLPAVGQVQGAVLDAGGQGVPTAQVTLETLESSGAFGPALTSLGADGSGAYAGGAPTGTLRVVGVDPGGSGLAGIATTSLDAVTPATVDVSLGNARVLPLLLDGPTFRFDLDCEGAITDGGSVTGAVRDAYDGAYRLRVDRNAFPCLAAATLEESGREVVLGEARLAAAVLVTRKVFVPPSGDFARYLEIIRNPGPQPVTIVADVEGELGHGFPPRVAVAPAATLGRYAVTRDDLGFTPAVGHVVAGSGTPGALPSLVGFTDGEKAFRTSWTLTLAPGETQALLHFSVQAPAGDVAAAEARAQALRDLTDPDALTGLSAGERGAVVNFQVP